MAYWKSIGCGETIETSDVGLPPAQARRPDFCPKHKSQTQMSYLGRHPQPHDYSVPGTTVVPVPP